ncbi:MAG: hypothetical protein JXB07_19245 [Anaerolineae bacterium]|nr:hypothetical protein [Anaerolineae bacterium]
MTDEELDRLSQTLGKINLAPFFFEEMKPMLIETLKWVATGLPLIMRDWKGRHENVEWRAYELTQSPLLNSFQRIFFGHCVKPGVAEKQHFWKGELG